MKTCALCQKRKRESGFGASRRNADGLSGYCKACARRACRIIELRRKLTAYAAKLGKAQNELMILEAKLAQYRERRQQAKVVPQ